MKFWPILRSLLPVLAVVGLLIAPAAAPAGTVAPAAMAAMADDMPCCPGGAPASPDCAKLCPLMAVCMAQCAQNVPVASAIAAPRRTLAGLLVPGHDVPGESLAQAPPPRPPRS